MPWLHAEVGDPRLVEAATPAARDKVLKLALEIGLHS